MNENIDIFRTILDMAWEECHSHVKHVEKWFDEKNLKEEEDYIVDARKDQLQFLKEVQSKIESMSEFEFLDLEAFEHNFDLENIEPRKFSERLESLMKRFRSASDNAESRKMVKISHYIVKECVPLCIQILRKQADQISELNNQIQQLERKLNE